MILLPRKLEHHLLQSLSNLRLASLIADLLMESHRKEKNGFPATVRFEAPGRTVEIPGTNCGFFTSPVIFCAILDVRRTLDFFRLRVEKGGDIVQLDGRRYPDDLYITDIGKPPLDPSRLFELGMEINGRPPGTALAEVCSYANKELAHFSKTEVSPELNSVIQSADLMREAILVFVYDALGLPRPETQPKVING